MVSFQETYGSILGTTAGTAATNIYIPYAEQQQALGNYYNQQSVMNQLQNAFAYGQGIAEISPEKIFKKAKGLLAELREEIDAWHGNILRA